MPNIAAALREEISRLARKEIRRQTSVLRKASVQYRKDIAEMKRRVSDLQRKITPLEKQVRKNVPAQAAEPEVEHVRFTAKGLRSQRKRLDLPSSYIRYPVKSCECAVFIGKEAWIRTRGADS